VFTQCSNCNTVFELSAEVLRAAGGQVRCGRCGSIFSALARLAEDAGSFDTGESAYEMEERADSILESEHIEQTLRASPDGDDDEAQGEYGNVEIAQLEVLDFSPDNFIDETVSDEHADADAASAEREAYTDAALEFTLPPGELDRIFVESSAGVMPPFHPRGSVELEHDPALEALTVPAAPPHPEAASAEAEEPLPDIEIISDDRALHHPSGLVRPLLSPVVELGSIDLSAAPNRPAGSLALWLSAAIAATLLLIVQLLDHNREVLTSSGPLAPMFRAVYARLGAPLSSAPNLAAFQLRQWGVTGEAAADPTLRVRASILNTTGELQPFPLLRVTLVNRFGSALGARDFTPSEYLGKPITRLLSPGEQVDAVLNILDPGKEAEGFEIDVCLPGADEKIVCANDAAPSQARQ
jgi:predicted Zn finger-like uncharacterized protein